MGFYINPGNVSFSAINTENYVDKTMLIDLVNQAIDSENPLICVSRPRRFGKSFAAKMLTSYYSAECDSHSLFSDKKIAGTENYEKHINKYNVITLDISKFTSRVLSEQIPFIKVPSLIIKAISDELDVMLEPSFREKELALKMLRAVEITGRKFVFIIDEWDDLIRQGKDDSKAQRAYLSFLRGLFKDFIFTPRVVAAAYMTGILPIKKDGSQSPLSDFREYTMLDPMDYAEFIGFTENEVEKLCLEKGVDFKKMKYWYNGYTFPSTGAVYNPNSVMNSIRSGKFKSYWVKTSSSEALLEYISKDYNGMSKTIAELVAGIDVKVDTLGFANDLTTFRGKDDVLTLLIHLGYLAYDEENETVHIANEEIKREFQSAIHTIPLEESRKRLEESESLFESTINMNEEEVARAIEKVHREETAPIFYNREDSLGSVIKLSYYTYRDHYLQFEELPAGDGYVDILYIPLPDSEYPSLLIELKYIESAEGAIEQIKEKKYPDCLKNYKGRLLLVGINYDRKTKKHSAVIEPYFL